MKKIVLCVLFLLFSAHFSLVKADECDTTPDLGRIRQCIDDLRKTADAIASANTTNAKDLAGLNSQIANLKAQITKFNLQIQKLQADVFERQVKIGVRETLLAARVKQDYIRKRDQTVLTTLFAADTAQGLFADLAYREKLARDDREVIASISGEIKALNDQSTNLKSQKTNLDALRSRVDDQATWLAGEVAKANAYVSDLSGKIASLTARQQSLLAQKTGTYQTSVGEVPLADDANARPDYNPGFSPAFALFSFGAPHFKGMSQYGAFGRAKNGQSTEDILRTYYGGGVEIKRDYPNETIVLGRYNSSGKLVCDQGSVDLETYAKRIYEMPGSWGDEGGMAALRAQAIAARSYGLATVKDSGCICMTESCQVYKPTNKGGKWEEAVNATSGWVLMVNGKPFWAKYASTSGGYQESYTYNGYSTPGFWDTTSDWTRWADGAWEVKGGSPWFYKGWYKGRSGSSCGRNHPWLRENEFADIINAAIVYAGGGDASGIFPTDGCLGQTGWSAERMAAEADKFGGKVTSVSNVTVNHGSDGVTNKVTFSTNRGNVEIPGQSFYKTFNLRAPGAIHLTSGLFNVERK